MPGPIGVIRAAASALVERAAWMRQAGVTFDGQRDLYTVLGYKPELRPEDYRARYERGGIAARIVEILPNVTWRGTGELIEDEDPDVSTAFEKEWDELSQRLGVWSIFRRADILAGLGRYSVILLGAPGEMEQPLSNFKAKDLMYLQPFAEEDAQITQFEDDVKNKRYGLPKQYNLRRTTVSALGRANFSRSVHWTRVIHVADGLLDDQVFGQPRLKRVWNYLDDLDKVAGGGAEAYWKRADQGMQINIAPDTKFTPEDKEDLRDQVEEYMHGLRRVLRTRGVDVSMLGSDVAPLNPIDPIMGLIATTIGVPQRILEGSERGELASSQDKSNFDDTVTDRRTTYAEPNVVRQFTDRLIEYKALPEPKQYSPRWPEIDDLNDSQKADMAQKWAGLNSAMGDVVVKPNEVRDRVLGLPPFTEKELAEIQAEKDAAAQKEADQSAANLETELATKAKFLPPEKVLSAAVANALTVAVAKGRRVLNTPALRAAIAKNDTEAMKQLLTASTQELGASLKADVESLL